MAFEQIKQVGVNVLKEFLGYAALQHLRKPIFSRLVIKRINFTHYCTSL